MSQKAKSLYNWVRHDFESKATFTVSIILMFWSNQTVYQNIICFWFANEYVPYFKDSFFHVSPNLSSQGVFIAYLLRTLFILTLICYLQASFSDPGFIDHKKLKIPEDIPSEKLKQTCSKCNNAWKPPLAHHCDLCGKCVSRYNINDQLDLHCIWTMNCVGVKNQKQFFLAIFYAFFYSLGVSALCVANFAFWLFGLREKKNEQEDYYGIGFGTFEKLVIFFFSVIFILVFGCGLHIRFDIIRANQTMEESSNGTCGRPRPISQRLERAFGTNKWTWLLPTPPDLKINALELSYNFKEVQQDKDGEEIYEEDDFQNLKIYKKYFI